jgi:peptide/nickel transport system substrate-binding protein
MKRATRWGVAAGAVAALPLVVAGCGGGGGGESSTAAPSEGKQGGTATFLWAADVDYVDPGQTFYTAGYNVLFATNRTLYAFLPSSGTEPVPDLADGPPTISADNKTVTVKLKKGVKYAPPVNREIKAADIKYAFERAYSKNVPSQYASAYFADIVGAPAIDKIGTGPIAPVSGIQTPDDNTIVFTLKSARGPVFAQSLVMPITVPVPEEYAKPFDAKTPSTYDQYVAFTGAYMIKNDPKTGELTGRVPGKEISMVRNPNWDKATDFRPAYLDAIEIQEGNDDLATAARRTLTGSKLICCDSGAPPAEVVKEALQNYKDQIAFIGSGSTRWVALNTTIKPLDNINIRKAIIASTNRDALRLTRGGAYLGDIAQGYIPPGVPGFEESGGVNANTDLDWMANPAGDPAVARKYMDAAAADGLPVKDGKWTGTDSLLTVATNADPGKKTAEAFQGQIEKLGFKLNLRIVPQDALYTKFCNVPAQKIAICTNVGFFRDFNDGQAVLDTTFNGAKILPVGNSNWSQLNVPAVNDALNAAAALPLGEERDKAFAKANRLIVEQAPAVPWIWDKSGNVFSDDLIVPLDPYATGPALTFVSVK